MDSGNNVGSTVVLPDGSEVFATGLIPPSIDPFQRFFTTDVLDFVEPSFTAPTPVQNGERFPDMKRIFLTSDEYLILETVSCRPRIRSNSRPIR